MQHSGVATIRQANTADDFEAFGVLVREYVASLPFVLDFQDIEAELAALDHEYGPPGGGVLLAESGGEVVGCVGVRPLEPPAIAELKRMYLRPHARGRGIGRALAAAALDLAAQLGYGSVRLDTVSELEAAGAVYRKLGFVEIPPYRHNPVPTAHFYELNLDKAGSR